MHPRLLLNDVHSRLNPTLVAEIIAPRCAADVVAAVVRARALGLSISISGARHAMGGQQFGAHGLHLDMRDMNRLLSLNQEKGLARVEAGITWRALLPELEAAQAANRAPWTFIQKQTGADELTLGGAVAANIHGRGLELRPFIQDIESLVIVDASGRRSRLSRSEDAALFRLVVGGYGMFGIVVEVELRLQRRQVLERVVEVTSLAGLARRIEARVADGFVLGDYQFCPDSTSPNYLKEGVFACYRPVPDATVSTAVTTLNAESWRRLMILAHSNMPQAWQEYKTHYQRTHGQTYLNDHAQLSHYDPGYEVNLEEVLPALPRGSLMITELYVPRDRLEDFMAACAEDFRRNNTWVIYGTIRFIRRDDESHLPWARQGYACIVFNLRVTHTTEGMGRARAAFRLLIARALERGGSFYLTYHRWATRDQLLRAYPELPDWLRLKELYDPGGLFQSEWYRHLCRMMLGDAPT